MTKSSVLLKEIENLPAKYYGEVLNFVGYLQQKAQNEITDDAESYQAMASDTEREQEASEWCNAWFGPVGGK